MRSNCRVDIDVPEPAKTALFCAPVGKRMVACMKYGLACLALFRAPAEAVSFGALQNIPAAFCRACTFFDSWHSAVLSLYAWKKSPARFLAHSKLRLSLAGNIARSRLFCVEMVLSGFATHEFAGSGYPQPFCV